MIRYCPTCDRTSDKARFVGEFCEFCVAEKVSRRFPTSARIEYCKRCGRIRTSEGYVTLNRESLGKALAKILCNSKCKIAVKKYDEASAEVTVLYPVDSDHVSFDKKISIKMAHQICQDDYRKSSGYYEAVVQLRGEKTRVLAMSKKLRNFAERRGAFVSKTEELDAGIDMYLSDKLMLRTFFLYNRLKPKASYTLFTVKNGRRVYRDTYLLKLD